MGKLYLKKKLINLPNLIIVEGFWQIGKTRLVNYLARKFNYFVIPEPNHITHKIKNNISQWYRKAHLKRYKKAIRQLNQGKRIIMERSIISNIAFSYSKTHKLPLNFQEDLEKLRKLRNFIVIFLYTDKNFAEEQALKLKDLLVKKQILDNPRFYQNYLYFYKNILPSLIERKIIFRKVNKDWKFKSLKEIL